MLNFKPIISSSSGNAYTVDDGKSKILIEMGLPIRKLKRALRFNLSSVSFALCSHFHKDHSHAINDVMTMGLDVFTSQETIDKLKLSGHNVHPVESEKQFSFCGWTGLPLRAEHDAPGTLAFLVMNSAGEKLLFITDTSYFRFKVPRVTILAIECNYDLDTLKTSDADPDRKKRVMLNHFGLHNVIKLLEANDLTQLKEIHLLHLSDGNSNEALIKREVQGLTGCPVYVAAA